MISASFASKANHVTRAANPLGLSARRKEDPPMRTQPGLSLTYGLVEQLGQAIVTGEYAEVGFPTEGELSKQFGASRTVTREAVKMLTA